MKIKSIEIQGTTLTLVNKNDDYYVQVTTDGVAPITSMPIAHLCTATETFDLWYSRTFNQ